VISLLVNNSSAILSSAVTSTQDLASYLSVLYAAAERYGLPEVVVTDGAAEILTVEHAGEPLSRYEVEAVTGELRSVSRGCSKPLGRFAIRGSSRWTPWARGRMTQGLESRGVRSEEPSPSRGVAAGAVRLSRGLGVASLFSHGTNFGCTEFYEVRMYPILGTPMF
jgi:hypothetical protein